jgi:hypothetical protein
MSAVKATWQNGQVVLQGKADWPEGRRLVVAEDQFVDLEFMTEDEQSDDPEAIERWVQEVQALPALTMTPEQEAEMLAGRELGVVDDLGYRYGSSRASGSR